MQGFELDGMWFDWMVVGVDPGWWPGGLVAWQKKPGWLLKGNWSGCLVYVDIGLGWS